MALWYMDSFDTYVTANLGQKFAAFSGSGLSLQANGRTGVQALNALVNSLSGVNAFPNATIKGLNMVVPVGGVLQWWIGAAILIPAGFLSTAAYYVHPWLFNQLGGAQGLGMQIRGDGSILNSFTNATAPAGTFQFGVWQYIEMQVTVNQAAMTIEVTIFVNDIQVADGTATAATLPTNVTSCQIGIPNSSTGSTTPPVGTYLLMDDFYLCDNTGAFTNSRCGDVDVFEGLPAGPGRVNGVWGNNGAGGAQNWQNCNQNPPVTTSYITDATAGDEECFVMTPPSGPASEVLAMQVSVLAQKSSASGNRVLAAGIGNGSAEGMNPGQALTNAWQFYIYPFSNDPVSGGAFDPTITYQAAVQTTT